ncbi:hypothetical protein BVRB_2g027320 [Beta vulgaris subsp. vulgaris]|nr:hypothetical protein BVRB_2g027320 [Beta vulgaris subsp. vulgaris]
MNSKEGKNSNSITLLHKVDPVDSFWNFRTQPKKTNNLNKWKVDEKRFAVTELFSSNRQRNASKDTFVLGPGAGAGVGCGVGLGLGLTGGAGYSFGLWNELRVVFGFGFGCGVGAGFGYGQGLGYGSSWKSIKSDVLGFKDKTESKNRKLVQF